MALFHWRRRDRSQAVTVQTASRSWGAGLPQGAGERELYRALRQNVPIIDASLYKLRRLLGDFHVTCRDSRAQEGLEEFLDTVQVNGAGAGAGEFLGIYFEELLTYGTAVGEMVLRGGKIGALYNAGLDQLDLEEDGPLGVKVWVREQGGRRECPFPKLLLGKKRVPLPQAAAGFCLEPRGGEALGHLGAAGAALRQRGAAADL